MAVRDLPLDWGKLIKIKKWRRRAAKVARAAEAQADACWIMSSAPSLPVPPRFCCSAATVARPHTAPPSRRGLASRRGQGRGDRRSSHFFASCGARRHCSAYSSAPPRLCSQQHSQPRVYLPPPRIPLSAYHLLTPLVGLRSCFCHHTGAAETFCCSSSPLRQVLRWSLPSRPRACAPWRRTATGTRTKVIHTYSCAAGALQQLGQNQQEEGKEQSQRMCCCSLHTHQSLPCLARPPCCVHPMSDLERMLERTRMHFSLRPVR